MAELTASFGPYARGKFWTASAPVVGLIKAAVATVCNNITADTMGGGAAQPISTYLGADYIKPADITGPAALTAAGLQTVVATAIGKKLFDETLAAPSAYTPHAGVATDYTDPKLLFKAIVKDVYDNYGEIGYGFADAPTVRTAAKQLFASAGAAPAVLAQKQNFILSSLITDKIIKFSHVADAFRQSWSNNQLRDALIAKINTFVNAVDAGGNSIPGMPDGTGIEKDAKVAAGFTWLQTLGATDDRLTAAATSGVNVNGTVTKAVFQELMSDATAFGVVATPGDPAATHDGIDHTTLLPVVQAMMMVYYGRVPADQNAIRDAAVAALSGEYTRVAALVGAGRATATNLEAAVEAGTGIGVAAMHLNGAAGVDALTALAALNVAGAPGAYILRRVGGGHLTALATGAANIAVGATGATADQVVVQDAIKDYFGLDAAPAVNAKVKAICQHYVTDVQMKDAICLKLNDAAAGHLHTFNDAGGIWQNIQGNANPLWVRANISNFTGAAAAHDPLLRPYTAYSTLTHTLDLAADGDTSIGAVKAAIGTRIDAAIDAGTRTAADTLANLVTNPAVADSQAKVFNDTADAAIAANSATYLADYLALAANAWAAPWVNMTHLMTQAIDANMMHTYDHYLGKSDNSWELSSATWPNYWLTDKPMLVGDILNADGTLKPAGQSFSMRWYAPGAGVAAQVTDLRALANSVYGVGFPNNAVVIARGAFPAGVAGLGQHAENAYVQAYGLNLGIMDLYSTASSLVFGTEAAWLDPAALTHACNWASVTAPGDNLRNGRKWVFGSIAQYLNAAYGLDNDVLVALAGDAAHGNEFRNSAVYNAAVPASGVHSPRGTDVQHKGAVLANLVALAPSMHVAVGTDIPGIGAGNKFPQLREEVRAYREMMETYRALQEFYAYSQTQAVEAVKNRAKWAMLCARRVHDLVLVGALANVDAAGNIAGRNGCNKVMTEIATTMGLEKAVDGTWGYAALLAGSKPVGSMTDCTAKIGVIFTAVATISPGGAGAGQLTRGMLVNEDPLAPQDFKRLLAAVGDMAITPKANPVPASSGAASSSTSSEQKLVTTSPYVSKGQLSNDVYRDVNVAAAVKPEMMSAVPLVQVSKMANQYVAQALKKGASNEVKVAAANASFAVAERTGTTNVIVMSTLSKPAQAEVRKLDTQIKVLDTQIRTGGVTQAAKKALATKRDLIAKKVVILRKAYQSSYGRMKVSAPRAPAKRGVAPKAAPAKGSVAPKPAPAKASAPKAAPKTAKAA